MNKVVMLVVGMVTMKVVMLVVGIYMSWHECSEQVLRVKMLYTRSTTAMSMHLEISMPMLEQQLPPLSCSQLIVVKAFPLKVVRLVLRRMW
jgi:hypothetical protein